MIITIDGPAVSGKSTLARAIAHLLGYYYLYSGSLFRALGYLLYTHAGYDAQNIAQVSQKDRDTFLDPTRFKYVYSQQNGERVFFDGVDITESLKTPVVDELASIVATNALVREALKDLQRTIAEGRDIVIDGRDSGTVVFPQADYTFYLTASAEERAKRMQQSLKKKGQSISVAQARSEIDERDARDTNRAISPLVKSEDAIVIDNTGLSKQETLKKILSYLDLKGGG